MMKNQQFKKDWENDIKTEDLQFINPQTILKSNQDISGQPVSTGVLILKKLFKNPYVVIASLIFCTLLLTAFIAPLVSQYDEYNAISSGKTSLLSFLNPSWVNGGFSSRAIVDGDDNFLKDLINEKIIDPQRLKDFIDVSSTGSMVLRFNPWAYLNNLDNTHHFSILGTDSIGRDIWTRLWIGTRQSLILAFAVVLVETIIGVILGAYIGFHAGSKIDTFAMRIVEIIRSVPSLIWFILLIFILPGGFLTLFLALALVGWTIPLARTRIQIIKIKDAEFIKASESIGTSKNGLIFKHALPNIVGKLLTGIVLRIPIIIFMESSLAFLGLSPSPNAASLGNLINDAKSYIQYWWYLLAPTTVILLITISLQIIGNGLHDAFDPQTS